MRLLSILALLAVCFVCSPGSDGQKPTAGQPDISRFGSNFLEACSSTDSEGNKNAVQIHNDATCLGWVEGFEDGFTVRDELLGVPEKDRIACIPRGATTIQIVRAIKKYLADYPEKAHRPTRYIASIALARAFPCKTGK
jgi:Ssp1 endopeptidase immunity protein Rap1a